MLKKIVLGILLVTVIGSAGAAIAYNAANQDQIVENISPIQAPQAQVVAQSGGFVASGQDMTEQPWQAEGTITALDETGLTMLLADGSSVYVELGPASFWQEQETKLSLGLPIIINGTENAGIYHASSVTLEDSQVLELRTDTNQPLWSGGADVDHGQNGQHVDGEQSPAPQAVVDEWITITGTLIAYQNGNMTISTPEGALIPFQTGQPRFFADQGVTFQVGDEVSITGFYENDQFSAGDITQIATGMRVFLRDPNGRPLWSGPGNNNGKGGNGGTTNGNAYGQGNH